MDSATPTLPRRANPNYSYKDPLKPRNAYHIGGIEVDFPYQPYGSQLAFMARVISTLDRAQKNGHCHALLESPTGTGKSLSLLCSALAWQKNVRSKNLLANISQSKLAPEAISDPLTHGGGFVPETEPSVSEDQEAAPSAPNNKNQKKKIAPTIFYASRTHSQLAQVIREYRKTSYRVPMAVLASRKHYCTNPHVRGKENIDEECKLLMNQNAKCLEFKNAHKVKSHPSLQKGGCHEAHDIEDLVNVGDVVKGCSYYAARSMADDAQLVFCPYSYIINPIFRSAMDIDIRRAIVILDEAHNIEDIARDAGSVDVDEDALDRLQTELQQLCQVDAMIYQPLYEMTQDITSWIHRRKSTLQKREFQHYFSCWTGDTALRELQESNISSQCFPTLYECATKAIKAATDTEAEEPHLSGMSVIILEGLFSTLRYFFAGNGLHMCDYQLALQRYVKKDAGNATGGWTHTFSLWCLNPAVVFREIADLSLSVILTSGTLSPMNSFSSELGVQFETCLEAPHVIDVASQLWAAVVPTGPGNYPLNASYKTADGYAFQDALGRSLEEICKIVPRGALVFFPSYKLMEKLCNRWRETGQWSRLNAQKPLYVEPRGGNQDDFDSVLKDYYNTICRPNRPTIGRRRRGKKVEISHPSAAESKESPKNEGAAFFAVCRGKVSEGIDFSDDNARVVIIVGIPFPNIHDIQVAQKKKYNDMYRSSKKLLSGNEWYCYQAFRALNQAAGRCIRHRLDYGAIILLDERFKEERNRAYISKWLRKSIIQYDNFAMSLEGLKSFFDDIKEQLGTKKVDLLQDTAIKVEDMPFMDQSNRTTKMKNQKQMKSNQNSGKYTLENLVATERSVQLDGFLSPTIKNSAFTNSKHEGNLHKYFQTDNSNGCVEYIDLECSPKRHTRCCNAISMASNHKEPEVSIVEETPSVDCSSIIATPSFCKDENSSSDFPNLLNLTGVSIKGPPSLVVTPERKACTHSPGLIPEAESSLNLSVNSHTQKRRRFLAAPLPYPVQVENNAGPHCYARCMESSTTTRDPLSSDPAMNKILLLFCSNCGYPLGRPENHLHVTCFLTSSRKLHLASLLKEKWEHLPLNTSPSPGIPVVVSDISSVNHELFDRTTEGAPSTGIWSERDGCVFKSIFCPSCANNNCLGIQIMATDASNVQLLNKVLFYVDHLEIKNFEASMEKDSLPTNHPTENGHVAFEVSNRPPYTQQSSGGWRTTKSKVNWNSIP